MCLNSLNLQLSNDLLCIPQSCLERNTNSLQCSSNLRCNQWCCLRCREVLLPFSTGVFIWTGPFLPSITGLKLKSYSNPKFNSYRDNQFLPSEITPIAKLFSISSTSLTKETRVKLSFLNLFKINNKTFIKCHNTLIKITGFNINNQEI